MNSTEPFKWRHFQKDVILLNVRWYLKYPLSYRNLELVAGFIPWGNLSGSLNLSGLSTI